MINNTSEKKGRHLTEIERGKIESGLNRNRTLTDISKELGRSTSTILREIQRNSDYEIGKTSTCAKARTCIRQHVCGDMSCENICSHVCKHKCILHCEVYERIECERLSKSPYVCNGCAKGNRSFCYLDKRIYKPKIAHERYRDKLVDCRAGFDLTEAELDEINKLISPMLKRGCSPYHISKSLAGEINLSQSTIYRLVDSGKLDARNIDLPEKVKRRPRKTKRRLMHNEVIHVSKEGRKYSDFLRYIQENETFHVEMDCVEGKRDEPKTLLTLHWKDMQMQLAFMMSRHNSANVVATLDKIERALGQSLFKSAFPVILTDNGSEFTNINAMERSVFDPNAKRTHIFFCDPNRSDEKGSCEVNHKLIRNVIPKGKSLMPYEQKDITLMMNHINSYRRQKSFGKAAYDVAMAIFPQEFFDRLGLVRIPDKKVTLKFELLRDARREYRKSYATLSAPDKKE